MPRLSPIQTNFTAGELSPRLLGREDISRYANGLQQLINMKVMPHGGATKRPGTYLAAEVKDSNDLARAIPFVFSNEQAYVLEFGDLYMRVYTDNGQVVDRDRILNGDFVTDISDWSDISSGAGSIAWNASGYMDIIGSVGGQGRGEQAIVALPVLEQTLTFDIIATGDETVTVKVGTSSGASDLLSSAQSGAGTKSVAFTPTTATTYITFEGVVSGSAAIDNVTCKATVDVFELTVPYLDTDLFQIFFTQSADTIYLTHPDYPVQKLTRTDHNNWQLTETVFIDGPYLDENVTAITITPSATTGSITLTASAALFQSAHVGALWRIKVSTTWGYVKVTGFTSDVLVNADVVSDLDGTTPTAAWQEGAWSGVRGYPSSVALFEQRLWFAHTAYEPTRIWGSKTALYEDMTPGVNDDDAIVYELATGKLDAIQWMTASRYLMLGTTGAEFRVGDDQAAITPTNIHVIQQTAHGSTKIQPVQIGHVTLFAQRARRKMRDLSYSFQEDSFIAPDLTLLSEHVTDPGIFQMDYQQEPDSIVWLVRDDGVLLGMTYERPQEVLAWHRHITDGEFESVVNIPIADADQVWAVVKRTINGATKRYVEYFTPEYQDGDVAADAIYSDSTLTYNGAPATVISGLDHLEGEAVTILADGAVHPSKTVASGAITLNYPASKVHVGLPYTATLQTLPVSANTQSGSVKGKKKRWAVIKAEIYNTMGLKVNGEEVAFRGTEDFMDTAVPLFSGTVDVPNLGYDEEGSITFTHEWPVPFTLLTQTGWLDANDD